MEVILFFCYMQMLLLHQNNLQSLRRAPQYLPQSLITVTLANNQIRDLAEVLNVSDITLSLVLPCVLSVTWCL